AQQNDVPWFVSLLISWLPFIALIGVWVFLSRQMQGAGGKALGFGKSRAKLLTEAHGRVTFEDVAGVDEAKQDLQEVVEFLRDPENVSRLWVFLPRQIQGAAGKPLGFGKPRARLLPEGHARVPFEDVAGWNEAKQNLQEIVEFRPDPENSSGWAAKFRAACCWSARLV